MVRQDLVGAIESGVARGQSLKDSMMSLFNAGYPREEIEAAAREVQKMQLAAKSKSVASTQPTKNSVQPKPIQKPASAPVKNISQYGAPTKQEQVQKRIQTSPRPMVQRTMPSRPIQEPSISNTTKKPESKSDSKFTPRIIMLGISEVLLFIALVLMFVFKDSIVDFFNSM